MKAVVIVVSLFAFWVVLSAGTISGHFSFACDEPSTYMISYAAVFTVSFIGSGDFTGLPYVVVAPPWDYEITYDFDDDTEYYAVGSVIISDFTDGNPMGIYPYSPFHTVDGNADSINILLDDTVDITIGLNVIGGSFDNIFVNVYDAIPYFFSGAEPTLEMTVPIDDTIQTITDIPAGPKYMQFFQDIDENGIWDESEPNIYIETPESNLVFAVGGFYDTIRTTFDIGAIANKSLPENATIMKVFPSPFNSSVRIDVRNAGNGDVIDICNISGKTVYCNTISGNESVLWKPENLSGGIYFVRLSGDSANIVKRIVYIP